jgi:hypothetical protein
MSTANHSKGLRASGMKGKLKKERQEIGISNEIKYLFNAMFDSNTGLDFTKHTHYACFDNFP